MGRKLLPGQTLLSFSADDAGAEDLPLGQMDLETQLGDTDLETQLESTLLALEVGPPKDEVNFFPSASAADAAMNGEPRPEIQAVHDLNALLLTASPLCSRCRCEVDPFRGQLKSKSAGAYICNNCNSKCVLISRNWGAGLLNQFKEMSEDEQEAFWKSLGSMQSVQQVKNQIADTLARRRSDKLIAASGGKYLPLSVWAQQGFNAADIEAHCTDTQQHPALGLCFRVCIESLDRTSVLEQTRTQILQSLDNVKPRKDKEPLAGKAEPAADTADKSAGEQLAEAAENSTSSSTSSSDSDSSSSSGKKKKKKSKSSKKTKKNTKADKKKKKADKLKAAAAAQKAEASAQSAAKKVQEKAAAKKKANAMRVKQKLLPFLAALDKAVVLVCFGCRFIC